MRRLLRTRRRSSGCPGSSPTTIWSAPTRTGGDLVDHKVKADEAVAEAAKQGQEVDKVLVWRRHEGQYASKVPMVDGRDVFVDDLLGEHRGKAVEPVSMPAEAPLFLMYTSGT